MRKAIISRMQTGHCLATFATDGVVTGTRVVGSPSDKLGDAAKHVATNSQVDQVGLKASDLGPNCMAIYGKVVWLKPGFQSC